MYNNVRGIKGKKESIIEVLDEYEPEIFLITETLLKCNTGFNIEGYTFYGKARKNAKGGGVGILVKNEIKNITAPHQTERDLEMLWLSVRRKNFPPILIGTYYGKQESRTNKAEIEFEMRLLQEEITEMKQEGEVLIAMDANSKIGLMDEQISRNGTLMIEVMNETGLQIMNKSIKCKGIITRQNTKNKEETSAIDFVAVTENVEKWIRQMTIDEEGIAKIRGKKTPSDHNTIFIDFNIKNIDKTYSVKRTTWNLRAPELKWTAFRQDIGKKLNNIQVNLKNDERTINEKYKKWLKEIEESAWKTIGKTTHREQKGEKFSEEVKNMRKQKPALKQKIQRAKNTVEKQDLIHQYKTLQEDIKEKIISERTEKIQEKFMKINEDKSQKSFWKAKREASKNHALEATIVKDENGNRVYSPGQIKDVTAKYYRNLYKKREIELRPFHVDVEQKIDEYEKDRGHELDLCNVPPTENEIAEIMNNKKNGKSTIDIKNEMLKKTGSEMNKYVTSLIETCWSEEKVPDSWKKGLITSLWKGRGDREVLSNHRGITVGSAVGSIMEDIIDKRILNTVNFTQAQGGGRAGASTYDHIFVLNGIIKISLHQKRKTFLTFYDVKKAFDNVDNNDMLKVMWDYGLRGKVWRILKDLSSNLKATIKTRHGNTEEINMEIGGKQGSKLTCRMFSKLMDLISEYIKTNKLGIKITEELMIGVLLWVDDVITCVEGEKNLNEILKILDTFAKDHKLKWGIEKCKVMPIGNHSKKEEWNFGEEKIKKCVSYKYLGDIITSNGKNKENISERKRKTVATTISINTIAGNEILNRIETPVILDLHEKITIPSLLNNAEAWELTLTDLKDIEQIEINSLKNLFNLPVRTPTNAVVFTLGTLYTDIRIHRKQLIYLHRILNRETDHWTNKMLQTLAELNIGWYKEIKKTLNIYGLEDNLDTIKTIPAQIWRATVREATEKRNRQKIIDNCNKKEGNMIVPKTKSLSILKTIENDNYIRKPCNEILSLSKNECKALIIARFGMLECGVNFKGTMNEICGTCDVLDNEEHRLNYCLKLKDINSFGETQKYPFNTIYSNDTDAIRSMIKKIDKVWNVSMGHGSMR